MAYLNREAAGVEVDDLARGFSAEQTPRLF